MCIYRAEASKRMQDRELAMLNDRIKRLKTSIQRDSQVNVQTVDFLEKQLKSLDATHKEWTNRYKADQEKIEEVGISLSLSLVSLYYYVYVIYD